MNKITFFVCLFFIFLNKIGQTQNLNKVFKNLEKGNLEEAIIELKKVDSKEKYSKKELLLIQIGTCIVLSNENSSNFRPYEANTIFKSLKMNSDEQYEVDEFLQKYQFDTHHKIPAIISNGIFVHAKKINTESSYDSVLAVCYPCIEHQDLLKLKAEAAYVECMKKQTIEAYKYFITKYPNSEHIDEVKKLLNKKAFDDARSKMTVEAMSEYLRNFSNSEFLYEAIILRDSLRLPKNRNYNSLKDYSEKYPNSKFTPEIINDLSNFLYKDAIEKNSLELFKEFIKTYPDDLRVNEIKTKSSNILYNNALERNSIDLLLEFINTYPNDLRVNEIKTKFQPAPFLLKNGKWILVNSLTLNPLNNDTYENLDFFKEGLARAKKDGKYGFIDIKGNVIIPFIYEFAHNFEGGVAQVVQIINNKDLRGYINKTGKIVIPMKFQGGIRPLNKNKGLVYAKEYEVDNPVIINLKNYQILSMSSYEKCGGESEGLIAVSKNGKWGFIDEKGDLVIPLIYSNVSLFQEELAAVERNGKWHFIDKTGSEIISEASKYNSLCGNCFNGGLALIERDSKFGFIDKRGAVKVAIEYDVALGFYEGVAPVKKNKKWGIVNSNGEEITTFSYDDANEFYRGFSRVRKNEKYGLIDNKGIEVFSIIYDDIKVFRKNLAAVKINEKWGFADRSGKMITQIIYDEIEYCYDEFALVKINETSFYVNFNGNELREK
jgi:outer membrane protein assembly factor BamD (BamD/ComL family)